MRLTLAHVSKVARPIADPGQRSGRTYATDADYAAVAESLLAKRPANGEVWVFAYGSLIWKPACDTVEQRIGVAHGWHRSFCLGWDRRFRGTEERPGLMLALDRGGAVKGVLQRLPADAVETNLDRLLRREMVTMPSPFPARWVTVETESGPVRAISFAIDRNGGSYVTGLSLDEVADVLATAVGFWGSMAEYLYNTVAHFEAIGIQDPYLWRLQEMVAARIERGSSFRSVDRRQQPWPTRGRFAALTRLAAEANARYGTLG